MLVFQSGPQIVIFRDFFKFFAILFRVGNENWTAPEHVVITGEQIRRRLRGESGRCVSVARRMTEEEIPIDPQMLTREQNDAIFGPSIRVFRFSEGCSSP